MAYFLYFSASSLLWNLLAVKKTYLLLKIAYSFYSSATSLLLEVLDFMEEKRNRKEILIWMEIVIGMEKIASAGRQTSRGPSWFSKNQKEKKSCAPIDNPR